MMLSQTIQVRDSLDIITARMRVREEARHLGLKLTEQSLISMATSSLANAMGLGLNHNATGQITIEDVQHGNRKGLKVICTRNNTDGFTPPPSYFVNERWMVDEFEVQAQASDQVEITMIKWAAM